MLPALHCALWLFVLQSTSVSADCPASSVPLQLTTGASSWCLSNRGSTKNFCEAVKTCHSAGQEMIGRDVYAAIKQASPSSSGTVPSHYWVGLTDALNERFSSVDGWVWIQDGKKTDIGSSLFAPSEPNGGIVETCVAASPSGLLDISCRFTTASLTPKILCYSSVNGSAVLPAAAPNIINEFYRTGIASYYQTDPGCYIDASSSRVNSRLLCSFRCVKLDQDCVGFYWHPGKRQCIVLTYLNNNVSLNYTGNEDKSRWEKFLRK